VGYLQHPVETNPERWSLVQPWVAASLAERPALPDGRLPLEAATQEGVLPWLAYRLHEAGLLGRLGEPEGAVRAVLSRCAAQHMFSETGLERLLAEAERSGVDFVAIKGHAVGRTLYPSLACRPTTDFDLLVAPDQAQRARDLLKELGYQPFNRFIGRYWLASQTWFHADGEQVRYAVDLHWDITNRMYFRHRADLAQLVQQAPRVACGDQAIRVTDTADSLIVACVHLAAFDPGLTVQMRWLLDIRLLLGALPASAIAGFVARAAEWCAVEACLVFGEAAARLDDAPGLHAVLEALRSAASRERMAEYDRTLRSRGYDLWRYWLRLGGRQKVGLVGDALRKALKR